MILILLGALGGFIYSGWLGLFIGLAGAAVINTVFARLSDR